MTQAPAPYDPDTLRQRILTLRGQKVILDTDLAALYGVEVKRLNEQVKRNRDRFPEDFAFQLQPEEADSLRSQIATSKMGRGGRRYLPYAFLETVRSGRRVPDISLQRSPMTSPCLEDFALSPEESQIAEECHELPEVLAYINGMGLEAVVENLAHDHRVPSLCK